MYMLVVKEMISDHSCISNIINKDNIDILEPNVDMLLV
jgi:hypothetical protein